jgi:pimeloyl-ACP methyl ester carboxylesterase
MKSELRELTKGLKWDLAAVPAVQKLPVISNLPSLVLAGEYDPITPPSNSQKVAQNLSRSYYFLFPGQGHGEEYSSACSDLIISAFEDHPDQQPAGACISQMTEPAFR